MDFVSADPDEGRARLHFFGAGLNCLDDIVVAGAAADVAFQLMADRVVGQFLAMGIDHVDGGHNHSRGTESTLQSVVLTEGFLHGMELVSAAQPFDGGDRRAVGLDGEHQAGANAHPVGEDRACPAYAVLAAGVGADETELVSEEVDQEQSGRHGPPMDRVVHGQGTEALYGALSVGIGVGRGINSIESTSNGP